MVNNLTTTTTNVPLSAAQGKVLNTAISGKSKVSIERISKTVTFSNGIGFVDLGTQSSNVFLVPVECLFSNDASFTAIFVIQLNRYARFSTYSSNSSLYNGSYQFSYLKITVS